MIEAETNHKGLRLGPWAVPAQVYAAMAVASLATCVLSALAVRVLLNRWPQKEETA